MKYYLIGCGLLGFNMITLFGAFAGVRFLENYINTLWNSSLIVMFLVILFLPLSFLLYSYKLIKSEFRRNILFSIVFTCLFYLSETGYLFYLYVIQFLHP